MKGVTGNNTALTPQLLRCIDMQGTSPHHLRSGCEAVIKDISSRCLCTPEMTNSITDKRLRLNGHPDLQWQVLL